MNYETIQQIVKNNNTNDFSVIINGKKEMKRLFLDRYGDVCEFRKRSHKEGDHIWSKYDLNEWENIIPIDYTTKLINVLESVIKYLSKSNIWHNLKEDCEKILALNHDVLKEIIAIELSCDWNHKYERIEKLLSDNGIEQCSFHSFVQLAEKGIKNVTFEKTDKESQINAINYAFEAKKDYYFEWEKRFPNQVSIFTNVGGEFVGHFFEGKFWGHYNDYYLLDATHALFKESV